MHKLKHCTLHIRFDFHIIMWRNYSNLDTHFSILNARTHLSNNIYAYNVQVIEIIKCAKTNCNQLWVICFFYCVNYNRKALTITTKYMSVNVHLENFSKPNDVEQQMLHMWPSLNQSFNSRIGRYECHRFFFSYFSIFHFSFQWKFRCDYSISFLSDFVIQLTQITHC